MLVVCPALNSQVRTWASDEDGARAAAQGRLDASLAQLERDGVQAEGEVGDGDPLQAIEDALRTFGADEIVISTHPEGRSHWLERNVVGAARDRFAVPITHVVVDLDAAAGSHVEPVPDMSGPGPGRVRNGHFRHRAPRGYRRSGASSAASPRSERRLARHAPRNRRRGVLP